MTVSQKKESGQRSAKAINWYNAITVAGRYRFLLQSRFFCDCNNHDELADFSDRPAERNPFVLPYPSAKKKG
jgi:hypothetical protein